MRYQIVSQTLNSDLFTVNDQTGQVYLRTNVLGNNVNQYNVSSLVWKISEHVSQNFVDDEKIILQSSGKQKYWILISIELNCFHPSSL